MGVTISIALGGALGATMRHLANLVALRAFGSSFPWGTMGINILGSFVMGVLVAVFAHYWQPSAEMKSFLTVGILGGFTTFSAFSLDAVMLWERGNLLAAAAYVGGSVILSLLALVAGLALVRNVAV